MGRPWVAWVRLWVVLAAAAENQDTTYGHQGHYAYYQDDNAQGPAATAVGTGCAPCACRTGTTLGSRIALGALGSGGAVSAVRSVVSVSAGGAVVAVLAGSAISAVRPVCAGSAKGAGSAVGSVFAVGAGLAGRAG